MHVLYRMSHMEQDAANRKLDRSVVRRVGLIVTTSTARSGGQGEQGSQADQHRGG